MFSHTIHNPHQIMIDTTDYIAIPFGHRCTSAIACKFANIRKQSLPFDWTIPTHPHRILEVLKHQFEDFIPDVRHNIFTNKYGITLQHFNPDTAIGILEHKRRIARFNQIMNTRDIKLYFVYINEDYLYNEYYRDDSVNNGIFNEMLDLEQFLRESHLDYAILYFNFKQHAIPSDSKIINIVIHTDAVSNSVDGSPYGKFRIYCGKVLADMFNTRVTVSIVNEEMFNN